MMNSPNDATFDIDLWTDIKLVWVLKRNTTIFHVLSQNKRIAVGAQFLPDILDANLCKNKQTNKQTN